MKLSSNWVGLGIMLLVSSCQQAQQPTQLTSSQLESSASSDVVEILNETATDMSINITATDDEDTTPLDEPITLAVLANDRAPENNPIKVFAVDRISANGGMVTLNEDSTVTYTPSTLFTGTDTFTYTITDTKGGTDSATVRVTVDWVNNVPVAIDDINVTPEDTPVIISVLGNDYDFDTDHLLVFEDSLSDPANGTVTLNPDGTVTYTPDPEFNGTDTFTYTITDGNGSTDSATVTVNVDELNDLPIAVGE